MRKNTNKRDKAWTVILSSSIVGSDVREHVFEKHHKHNGKIETNR